MGEPTREGSKISPPRRPDNESDPGKPIFPGEEKDHDPSRRSFLLRMILMTASASLLTGGYAWLWEPRHLEIKQVELKLPGFPKAFEGLRVAQFSDAHLGFHTGLKQMEKLAETIHEQQPDLICFTGDMVEREAEPMRECIPVLASMQAKYGKYAVLGNHDYRGRQQNEVEIMFKEAGFTLLRNSHALIEEGNSRLAIAGLDDALTGRPDPAAAIRGLDNKVWKLLLMHEPDYADISAPFGFGLQLSGHSHGGQVRFPWIGALTTPRGSRKYIQGLYYAGERHMPVYVNRGFGMTQLPIRFLCRPELTVFELRG
ncbi:metallophosphoesterase [Paenibacillus sp. JNUCC31]|uniref:metallophosphoesterase n=1 Tax=Paenibacillus sp. JNUCC-31 TaxID=2777983 RepID=UPI001783832F|nr:metallophosphoesterase [Paenibacillus sp. JNUCC-31]QOS80944.1 metallophosphoesterase [Paenibacillus sp. JNUCC-31]